MKHKNSIGNILTNCLLLSFFSTFMGCSCLFFPNHPIDQFDFTVFRPQKVYIYKPIAGSPASNDKILIYLAIENESGCRAPMCMALYNKENEQWESDFFFNIRPVVRVENMGAPIIGDPKVKVIGIAGRTISPGERFPEVSSEFDEFPINESVFRKDFVIEIVPNRIASNISGHLKVTFFLENLEKVNKEQHEITSQIAEFMIPIEIVDDFKPDAMLPEPSKEK